jgi:hypothetical protein
MEQLNFNHYLRPGGSNENFGGRDPEDPIINSLYRNHANLIRLYPQNYNITLDYFRIHHPNEYNGFLEYLRRNGR